ncbi:MAG: hypothetical protein MI919_42100 [Holophagales bacterium]|nr:hypothetical protein [Holophagales bacterium]
MSRSAPPAPPDLEALAAYAAGRLEGEAHEAVVERLSMDATYRELLDELRSFQETESELRRELEAAFDSQDAGGEPGTDTSSDEGSQPSGVRVLRFLPRGSRGLLQALAALMVLAAGMIAWRQSLPSPAASYWTHLEVGTLAQIEAEEESGTVPWIDRGRGDEPPLDELERAERAYCFRAGVLAVDLRLAQRDGERRIFGNRLREMLVLDDLLLSFPIWAPPFERMEDAMEAAGPEGPIPVSAEALEAAIAPLFEAENIEWPESVRLGAWTRSCWMAARGGHRKAFEPGPFGGPWAGGPLARPHLEGLSAEERDWVSGALAAASAGDLEATGERCWRILARAGRF